MILLFSVINDNALIPNHAGIRALLFSYVSLLSLSVIHHGFFVLAVLPYYHYALVWAAVVELFSVKRIGLVWL